jgi:uncharacterized repeat protein (TIGR02543 family)
LEYFSKEEFMNKKIIFLLTTVLVFSVLLAGCNTEAPTFDCKVKFYATDDSIEPFKTVTVESGSTMGGKLPGAPNAPRDNVTFHGWFEGETEYTRSSVINTDLELVAKWKDELITVSFEAGIDAVPVNPIQLIPGTSLGVRYPETRKRGFPFDGWFLDATEYTQDTPITESITLTAQWGPELRKFILTFSDQSGQTFSPIEMYEEEAMGNRYPVVAERSNEDLDPTDYRGWRFDGWLGQIPDTQLYKPDTPVRRTDLLTAQWTRLVVLETFDLDLNAGPAPDPAKPADPVRNRPSRNYENGVLTAISFANDECLDLNLGNSNTERIRVQLTRAQTITVEIDGESDPEDAMFRLIFGQMETANEWDATGPTGNVAFEDFHNIKVSPSSYGRDIGKMKALIIQARDTSNATVTIRSIKVSVE